jgi:hypothetical protein
MTGRGHRRRSRSRSWVCRMAATAGRHLRALMPPMTPTVLFRALLGVLLFFFGIVFGVWLIIRFRRHSQDSIL